MLFDPLEWAHARIQGQAHCGVSERLEHPYFLKDRRFPAASCRELQYYCMHLSNPGRPAAGVSVVASGILPDGRDNGIDDLQRVPERLKRR